MILEMICHVGKESTFQNQTTKQSLPSQRPQRWAMSKRRKERAQEVALVEGRVNHGELAKPRSRNPSNPSIQNPSFLTPRLPSPHPQSHNVQDSSDSDSDVKPRRDLAHSSTPLRLSPLPSRPGSRARSRSPRPPSSPQPGRFIDDHHQIQTPNAEYPPSPYLASYAASPALLRSTTPTAGRNATKPHMVTNIEQNRSLRKSDQRSTEKPSSAYSHTQAKPALPKTIGTEHSFTSPQPQTYPLTPSRLPVRSRSALRAAPLTRSHEQIPNTETFDPAPPARANTAQNSRYSTVPHAAMMTPNSSSYLPMNDGGRYQHAAVSLQRLGELDFGTMNDPAHFDQGGLLVEQPENDASSWMDVVEDPLDTQHHVKHDQNFDSDPSLSGARDMYSTIEGPLVSAAESLKLSWKKAQRGDELEHPRNYGTPQVSIPVAEPPPNSRPRSKSTSDTVSKTPWRARLGFATKDSPSNAGAMANDLLIGHPRTDRFGKSPRGSR